MNNTLFPVFLKTDTARFLIVGGGYVGIEKTETLLRNNPEVLITLVGTQIQPKLWEIARFHSNITLVERAFEPNDLEHIDYAIIATNDSQINAHIRVLAKEKKIKVNAADQPDLCDFYLGSVVSKGHLKIAISTNGKSPVLARRFREYFEETIPDNINESIDALNAFRNQHKGDFKERLVDLNSLTKGLTLQKDKNPPQKYKKLFLQIALVLMIFFIGFGISNFITPKYVMNQVELILNGFSAML